MPTVKNKECGEKGSVCDYKKAKGEVIVVMEMFCALTMLMSVSWMWYYNTVSNMSASGEIW